MQIDFTFAPWGMAYAALMYVLGNGTWTNHLARRNAWLGWLMWATSALLIIILGAVIGQHLGNKGDLLSILGSMNKENYWIILTLYALMSIPGAASVLFRQSMSWTRLALLATAMIVFIPLGSQLHDPDNARLGISIGMMLAICGLMWIWSIMLDCEPEQHRKTVPLDEMAK
ncbi:MAG: hypothetical protein COW18_10790 [Zetaproteobacteria bacterium CG12_big_fil_rev_8_21_14_0_65_54_13]|nr:MAG: hypothetical protein COW18_10790 [Zetaproteobacteria bacterium CG12_big_fil_rev_8_21_14_0_65_54_13]PIX53956.1 MAG: hypothetical protein COZ50_10550 [Zetaproteobacteria bacterium CG_4_10_14_3_um_filter_54_28]PJA30562.1 MAG: hypothetical protein CO188_03015 [Zetaproteobacteria bacterium CG_4_9_14_3_um_filter_54_145]